MAQVFGVFAVLTGSRGFGQGACLPPVRGARVLPVKMILKTLVAGPFATNCYVVRSELTEGKEKG